MALLLNLVKGISCMSRVCVSVRPRLLFIREKHPKLSWLGAHRPIKQLQPGRRRRWVGVYASMCVCACACMHARVRDVFAIIYDYN